MEWGEGGRKNVESRSWKAGRKLQAGSPRALVRLSWSKQASFPQAVHGGWIRDERPPA